ncbi:ATP synthase subunit I [Sulfuriferula nivalis]|uniref:F1F0 ATPase n=1 Tax=Sulfuriferula nivalis TaxID=2675298 RepID=A0A809S9Q2_9PROT|nr:ATP synthase subunit I [Sulfuriferula nivalis]BBP01082.1 F1F0 ATPase [Sulfuriferula nivalis]
MNEIWGLMPSLLAGLALGALFFGGLWWTVQKGLTADRPALWFLSSMLIRTGITVGGFYIVGNHDFRRLLACLAGFIIARFIVTRMTRLSVTTTGGSHAS